MTNRGPSDLRSSALIGITHVPNWGNRGILVAVGGLRTDEATTPTGFFEARVRAGGSRNQEGYSSEGDG
ncbi:hypothetical protein VTH82DRAFT_1990 [Thermothelomyces myriococcoides]